MKDTFEFNAFKQIMIQKVNVHEFMQWCTNTVKIKSATAFLLKQFSPLC